MDFEPRRTPCTHCGDTVLVAIRPPTKRFGITFGKPKITRYEHADPSPSGDVFDGVDEACRRQRVAG